MVQVAASASDAAAASNARYGLICLFLFPYPAMAPRRAAPTATPRPEDREGAGPGRIWLYLRIQHADKELQSACFTTSHKTNLPPPINSTTSVPETTRSRGHRLGSRRNPPRDMGFNNFRK